MKNRSAAHSEVLTEPEAQGKFFSYDYIAQTEKMIKNWGFKYICFMTVIRQSNDPRRPKNYRDLLFQIVQERLAMN